MNEYKVGDELIFALKASFMPEVEGDYPVTVMEVRYDVNGRPLYDVAYTYGMGGERGLRAGSLRRADDDN